MTSSVAGEGYVREDLFTAHTCQPAISARPYHRTSSDRIGQPVALVNLNVHPTKVPIAREKPKWTKTFARIATAVRPVWT